MSTTTAPPGTGLLLEPAATVRARSGVEELLADLATGGWRPTPLEVRVAALLLTSTAGDGQLTSRRIRAALWEGAVTLVHDNGGRFAQALAGLVPVLDDPQLTAPGLPGTAGELVAAVAAASG
ncbi:hypothetical protein ACF08B_41330 [Streptomyces sp. NPDC015139]|uniref:hypothetical protein n=1 Tax=Streptomyces sp. NPDC015139 TaxID=3364942 RepID=UPI0036FEB18E